MLPITTTAALPHDDNAVPSSGTVATRSSRAQHHLVDARGRRLDGRGVSIAVIDTGIDTTHPAFATRAGGSKVVRSLSAIPCARYGEESPYTHETSSDPSCLTDMPTGTSTDTGHGGHGTFVGGVAVGNRFRLPDGTRVGGSAPGARLVFISTTTTLLGTTNAFAWILRHHAAPCGRTVSRSVCPPIRVVSCSWGALSPDLFRMQAALARRGVVTVWANGNTGGDGSTDNSNPAVTAGAKGVIGVGSYDDGGTGTRNGHLSPTSSRGLATEPRTWPDISAPGVNIISACRAYLVICPAIETTPPRNGPNRDDLATYFTGSGTSFAAPQVAGIAAQLFQAKPRASAPLVESVIKRTAHRFADGASYQRLAGYSSSYDKGAGLIDAYAAALRLGARRV